MDFEEYQAILAEEEIRRKGQEKPVTTPSPRAQALIEKIRRGERTNLPPPPPPTVKPSPEAQALIERIQRKEPSLQAIRPSVEVEKVKALAQRTDLYPTATIIANSAEYRDRVAKELAKGRFMEGQEQAEYRVTHAMLKEGKAVKVLNAGEKAKITRDFQNTLKATASEKEWEQYRQRSADYSFNPLEQFVPGVGTARYWTRTTVVEKAVSIASDVLATAFILFGAKLIPTPKTPASEALSQLAKQAGKTAQSAKVASQSYEMYLLSGQSKLPGGKSMLLKFSNNAQKATQASFTADKKFLNYLQAIDKVSPKELKLLEKTSKIRGLSSAIKDVTKASKQLDRAWAKIPEKQLFTTPSDVWARTGKMIKMTKVNQSQFNLQKALDRADSILKPRYSTKLTPELPKLSIKPKNQLKLDLADLNRIINTQKAFERITPKEPIGKPAGRVTTAVKERLALDLKLKQAPKAKMPTAKVEPALTPKAKVPAVTKATPSVFPGVKPKIKAIETERPLTIEEERELRTQKQKPDVQRDTGLKEDVVSKSVTEDIVQPTKKVTPTPGTPAGPSTAVTPTTTIKTPTETPTKTTPEMTTKPTIETPPKSPTKTTTRTPPTTPIPPKTPGKFVVPPIRIPIPAGKGGKKKKWTEEEIESAIAWKDGFVVHALKSPYRRGVDEKTFHISKVPKRLHVLNISGPGSQQKTARVTGKFPSQVTVDVGNQDVVISRVNSNRVSLRHVRDTTGTVSGMTIKRAINRPVSRKRGGIYHTRVDGGLVLSRKPLRVF